MFLNDCQVNHKITNASAGMGLVSVRVFEGSEWDVFQGEVVVWSVNDEALESNVGFH